MTPERIEAIKRNTGSMLADLWPAELRALCDLALRGLAAAEPVALVERTAQLIAHRACCGSEHDMAAGKIHGYCVVCGVQWPCAYAGTPPTPPAAEQTGEALAEKVPVRAVYRGDSWAVISGSAPDVKVIAEFRENMQDETTAFAAGYNTALKGTK